MSSVELVHWNPRVSKRPWRFGRTNNFGDLLGPMIVREIAKRLGLGRSRDRGSRLLSVGSVLRLARDGDVVWGTGVNGKSREHDYSSVKLDVRSVRGPLTRDLLMANGHHVPPVFGDPGLLVGDLWDRALFFRREVRNDVLVVPNLHDLRSFDSGPGVLDPTRPVMECLQAIASSDFVVGSSLHGIVVAEAFGIPARILRSATEPPFKYLDYYLGTGRSHCHWASGVLEAIELGGEPPPRWNSSDLYGSFPVDLWEAKG